MDDVIIVGGGIGGLTLALMLHERGISCRVYEAAPQIQPIGVGISLLPHASKELGLLGLTDALSEEAVTTRESCFFNRFGQFVYSEPVGRYAGYDWPQFQIHRGDLQQVLHRAYLDRVVDGAERVLTGHRCTGAGSDARGAVAHFVDSSTGAALPPARGAAVIGCDGIHSAVRRQFFGDEGPPVYSGVNMWRGTTVWEPFLSGSTYLRAGWLTVGKMVIYPIRHNVDGRGRQLVNWVAEVQTDSYSEQDWNRVGRLEDFHHVFADWTFDWLDVAGLIRGAEQILEYPMVDRDPLPRWTHDRVTLLGDAAHPMYPRGSNGAGQAILDARALADCLQSAGSIPEALECYEDQRLSATAAVVQASRSAPPDVILKTVHERTGDRPFERITDVISAAEMAALNDSYKRVAGYHRESLSSRTHP
ncbi:MAG: flavin-dependent oxidoreductase [Acidimicrobiaceae bacterium]|nr:flavin-dependent oxidoreductase [Acidimicrobiaceae bacterium]